MALAPIPNPPARRIKKENRFMHPIRKTALLLCLSLSGFSLQADQSPPSLQELGRAPLCFERNEGQTAPCVSFLARGEGYTLFVTPVEAVFALAGTAGAARPTLRMTFPGADPDAVAVGCEKLGERVNYYRGQDPERWIQGAPTFARIECAQIYPGVDLVYRGTGEQLAYDFIVAPGIDPEVIRIAFEGVTDLELDADGGLLLCSAHGTSVHRAPVVYQEDLGGRQPVAGRFVLRGKHEVGFDVSGHDPSRPLVIDPDVIFSTLLGGSGDDSATGVAVDGDGYVYVAGSTASVDFPQAGGGLGGSRDAFIVKLDPTGTSIEFSTYFGGAGSETAWDIGLVPDGTSGATNALVAGSTSSTDLPTTAGAFQPAYGGGSSDGFVARFDEWGGLTYATYLGGSEYDSVTGLAVGPLDQAYVTGPTKSSGLATPGAYDEDFNSVSLSDDVYLAVISSGGTLDYLTYLGGGLRDRPRDIAVDLHGHAYLTGSTTNSANHPPVFPTTANAYRADILLGHNTTLDSVFISKIDPGVSGVGGLLYSTVLMRDPGLQSGGAIAADDFGRAYVTGVCHDQLSTTDGAFDEKYNGGKFFRLQDAFVAILDTDVAGTDGLVYSTYLGGYRGEHPFAIAVTGASEGTLGEVHVAGMVPIGDVHPKDRVVLPFPVTDDAFLAAPAAGYGDGFLTRLRPAGDGEADLLFSTLIGGNGADTVYGLAIDSAGRVYVAGQTESTDFEPTPDTTLAGVLQEAFVFGIEYGTVTDPPAAPTGLVATAVSDTQIDLAWVDNADNEDGFEVERSLDGQDWGLVATPGANSVDHPDTELDAETMYFYRIRAFNAVGESGYTDVAFATTLPGGGGDGTATGEVLVAGTITAGDYVSTHVADDVYEAITERESSGKPSNRYSYLEHKWTFDIPAGTTATVKLEAYRPTSPDGDDFVFAWSTDDLSYEDMFVVTKTSDDDVPQTFALPPGISGPVFIRVLDTDPTSGNRDLDTIHVDYLFISVE
jgi:hypothetical protein